MDLRKQKLIYKSVTAILFSATIIFMYLNRWSLTTSGWEYLILLTAFSVIGMIWLIKAKKWENLPWPLTFLWIEILFLTVLENLSVHAELWEIPKYSSSNPWYCTWAAMGALLFLYLLSRILFTKKSFWVGNILTALFFLLALAAPQLYKAAARAVAEDRLSLIVSSESLENFSYLALVSGDGGYGFINERGEEVIPCQFDSIDCTGIFSGSFRIAASKYISLNEFSEISYSYLLDKKGNQIGEGYDDICAFFPEKNAIIVVNYDEGWGAVNKNGEVIIPLAYKEEEVYEKLQEELPDSFSDLPTESNGLYIVDETEDRLPYIADKSGNIILSSEKDLKYPNQFFYSFKFAQNGSNSIIAEIVSIEDEEWISRNALYDSSGNLLLPAGDYTLSGQGHTCLKP